MAESIKSKYKPSFPKKYKGNPNNIICRSSWERKFCRYCDLNENILQWGSEEFFIPYVSPVDRKVHSLSLLWWLSLSLWFYLNNVSFDMTCVFFDLDNEVREIFVNFSINR